MPLSKRLLRIALIVELLLFLGFLPTLFNPNAHIYGGTGGGWDWSPWGFVGPMAALMFMTGIGIDTAARSIEHPIIRAIVIVGLVCGLGFIWAQIVRSE
jgi:amino acid transporter